MKQNNRKLLFSILCAGACILFLCPDSFAAEKMTEGRKLYDTIMLWVNFGILVGLFIKFARKPLMDFLHGVRSKLEGEIGEITEQHSDRKVGLDSEEAKLGDIQTHLGEIRARIVEMGEKEKQKIVDQAKIAAEKMIEDAKAYASFQIDKARKQLSDEMIDIAISMVEKRLEKEITLKDNDKLVNDFLVNLETTKPHLN